MFKDSSRIGENSQSSKESVCPRDNLTLKLIFFNSNSNYQFHIIYYLMV